MWCISLSYLAPNLNANEKALIEFNASAVSVMENCKTLQLGVERSGNIELQAHVG